MAIHQEFACGMCILRDPIYLYKSSTVAKILYTFIKTTLRGGMLNLLLRIFRNNPPDEKERSKKLLESDERRRNCLHISKIWGGYVWSVLGCAFDSNLRLSIYHRSFFPSSSFFLVVYYNGYIYSQTCRYYYFRPTKKNMFFFFLLQKSSARIFQFDGSTPRKSVVCEFHWWTPEVKWMRPCVS